MIAFSSTSSIGIDARCTRWRIDSGTVRHRARQSASTSAPSGSSVTPDTSGPASMRWASPGPSAAILTNPSSTPAMSLSRSQRLTCTMSRASWGGGAPSAIRPVWCRSVPGVPSRRSKSTGPSGSAPVTSPTVARIALDRHRVELAVLGRERIDGRRDDDDPLSVHPVRHVLQPREHEGVGVFDVRPEERPRLVRLGVAGVAPDVAAPHDPHAASRAGRRPCRRSAGRGAARSRASRSGAPSRRRSRSTTSFVRSALDRCRVAHRRRGHRATGCAAAS